MRTESEYAEMGQDEAHATAIAEARELLFSTSPNGCERIMRIHMEIEKQIRRIRAERKMKRSEMMAIEVIPNSWDVWRDVMAGMGIPFRSSAGAIHPLLCFPGGG